ncbi:cysteine desulfurase family protein [Arenibaculum sp.]|jgi:cysteine desulfurase|uniref:cysteine desulfurase family protein n=1 Tax=Arenibaculum sp. TaxID=2865862 RepID=UPI002E11510A|nr:cysteine desulfurase family protein [Arenibaculum sp.]
MKRNYLDYNATAPLRPAVREAMVRALDLLGNPSSVHADGRAARRAVEDARAEVAALVGAMPAQVVFTGGGTEANNQALASAGGRSVLVSAIEHDSVLEAVPSARRIPVEPSGVVDLAALDRMLADARGPSLLSLMLVNNETGVIQPVAEAARIARSRGALVHCDAVQAAGRLAIDLNGLGADMLSLSAHKIGGPKGVGALVLRDGVVCPPLLRGGGQEQRRRAGTENVPGIVGFGRAARDVLAGFGDVARIDGLRRSMEERIRAVAPDAPIHGGAAPRVANTSCIGMPGVPAEIQVMAFDLAGIAVSAGSACSSGKVKPSHVLTAMGLAQADAASAVRVSLGRDTVAEEIDRFVEAWTTLHRRRRAA